MFPGKKPFKYWNSTLELQWESLCTSHITVHTWRRSSKSRPVRFFMPDMLLLNFRIISRPNVGTWQYLVECRSEEIVYVLNLHTVRLAFGWHPHQWCTKSASSVWTLLSIHPVQTCVVDLEQILYKNQAHMVRVLQRTHSETKVNA